MAAQQQSQNGQDVQLQAFKYALDPTDAQRAHLHQLAGAARQAYNAYVAEMRARHQRWTEARQRLINTGLADPAQLKTAMKQIAAECPPGEEIGHISWTAFGTTWLTSARQTHQQAADRITAGEDPETVMAGDRYSTPWMHAVPRRVQVSGLRDANAAWQAWMSSATGQRKGRRVGFPRFKKKAGARDSFTIPAPEKMGAKGTTWGSGRNKQSIDDYRHVYAAGIGSLRTHQNTRRMVRALERGGTLRSFTISRNADRWYISFLVASPAPQAGPTKAQQNNGTVGVDVGVSTLAALSTGEKVENTRAGANAERRIKTLQRKIARSQKGSNRRKRLVAQLAKTHHRVALRRRTYTDKLTKQLATTYAAVGIEDLNVAGMTVSAKGTIEAPGKNVRAKSGLNRNVLDASFGEIRRQLEYKTQWYGTTLVTIDRYYPSSKTCSTCGTVKPKLSLGERIFSCEHCGYAADRDVNAARNIRAVADSMLAPGRGESLNGRGGEATEPATLAHAIPVESSSPPPPGGHQAQEIAPLPT